MRQKPTEEQKQAALEKRTRFRELWRKVARMPEAERQVMAAAHGIVTCEGHALSIQNSCIVMAQSEGKECPSIVGGFQQWRRQGRMVKKGEHGYMIWIPTNGKGKTNGDAATNDDDNEVMFLIGYVFDITQTAEEVASS